LLHSKQPALSGVSDLLNLPSACSTTMPASPVLGLPGTPVLEGNGTELAPVESNTTSALTSRQSVAHPTYRRRPVDFSDLPVRNLDQRAF
jgi:hypothetical protein